MAYLTTIMSGLSLLMIHDKVDVTEVLSALKVYKLKEKTQIIRELTNIKKTLTKYNVKDKNTEEYKQLLEKVKNLFNTSIDNKHDKEEIISELNELDNLNDIDLLGIDSTDLEDQTNIFLDENELDELDLLDDENPFDTLGNILACKEQEIIDNTDELEKYMKYTKSDILKLPGDRDVNLNRYNNINKEYNKLPVSKKYISESLPLLSEPSVDLVKYLTEKLFLIDDLIQEVTKIIDNNSENVYSLPLNIKFNNSMFTKITLKRISQQKRTPKKTVEFINEIDRYLNPDTGVEESHTDLDTLVYKELSAVYGTGFITNIEKDNELATRFNKICEGIRAYNNTISEILPNSSFKDIMNIFKEVCLSLNITGLLINPVEDLINTAVHLTDKSVRSPLNDQNRICFQCVKLSLVSEKNSFISKGV